MSKRSSIGNQRNTLFNYFQSPKSKAEQKGVSLKSPEITSNQKEPEPEENDEQGESPITIKKKRNRVINDSDDDNEDPESIGNVMPVKRLRLDVSDKEEEEDTTKRLVKFKFQKDDENLQENAFEQSVTPTKKIKSSVSSNTEISGDKDGNWKHYYLDFLKPEKICDANRHRPDHSDYDPRTLYVPDTFLSSQTPAHRQWWIMKSKHFDSVLFFKVGKFYELYHMDAVIGVNYLGFSYMKNDFAHSGFPESAYGRMANTLIENGFKVARVEQTETPEMMTERCKTIKPTKYDKVVKREICQISTKGTCVYGPQNTDAKQALPCYMIAINKKDLPNSQKRFGIAFVETSIGVFNISQFDDDKHCSRFLALLAQHPPGLVLTERGNFKANDLQLLKRTIGNVRHDTLAPESEFYSAQTTIKNLTCGPYFLNESGDLEWPSVFDELVKDGVPAPEYELALKSLGACIWYLKDSQLDIQVLSLKKFQIFRPVDLNSKESVQKNFMVLDAVTIENLDLLGSQSSLQKVIDHSKTAFGKRLIQQWICRPLCNIEKIIERQKAVKELHNNLEMLQSAQAILKQLPDLERQLAKIHTFGNKYYSQNHPDSRAIFYELKTYTKRRIFDLVDTINGFDKAQMIWEIFKDCESRLLRKLTQRPPKGVFIDLSKEIDFFRNAFNQEEAKKEGKIIPQNGIDKDFDRVNDEIAELNEELKIYLKKQEKIFGCTIQYFGTDKKRFQLEIPENRTHKVTSEYMFEGTKKGKNAAKRYSTPATKKFLAEMIKLETERTKIIQDLNRRIFEKFSARQESWEQVIHCLTTLDALCSLAEFARIYSEDICLPNVLPFSNTPLIKIENGRHPCVNNVENFVPNNIELGTKDHPCVLLLTGPNMGGKSTLMRQTAVIMILAQLGSFVPASSCEMSVVDRIFTRLGAQDDIFHGQSTFMVELSEASAILQHAGVNSFALIDELGRGTSTHDGTAVATAYVSKLVEINCRTIFSTHYHTLVDHYISRNDVQLGHMTCIVENEGNVAEETVTFLYKMIGGQCPKSYGFNVAKLAGLPQSILLRAHSMAQDFENKTKNRMLFVKTMAANANSLRDILLQLQ